MRTTAVQVEQEICQWLREGVPNPSTFPLSCSESVEDIKTTIDRVCTVWDYSVMAASVAYDSFSSTELMSEVDRWVCNHGLQSNSAVMLAGFPINSCPTVPPTKFTPPPTTERPTRSTPPPTTQPRRRTGRATTNLFPESQVIES